MLTKRDPIIQQLKRLNAITPDPVFSARLRNTIVGAHEIRSVSFVSSLFRWPTFAVAGTGVFVLLAFIFIGKFGEPSTVRASSLDTTTLTKEFDELTLGIQLNEINYQDEVNTAITEAIDEIGSSETNHLNPSLLDAEQDILMFDEPINGEINILLDELTE